MHSSSDGDGGLLWDKGENHGPPPHAVDGSILLKPSPSQTKSCHKYVMVIRFLSMSCVHWGLNTMYLFLLLLEGKIDMEFVRKVGRRNKVKPRQGGRLK